ncbi:hypothetical protein BC830DRAFT_17270 [Chytriomyces sp. MP71]|nr:hypothetical protein BC830DRAFT_17270 [Chytriomyces sp. MP71]
MVNTWFECGIACMPVQQFDAWMALFSDYFRATLELASPSQRARMYPHVTVAIAEPLTRILHSPMGQQFMQGFIRGLSATFPYREDISQEEASGASTVGCNVQFFCDALGGPKEGLRVLGAAVLGMTDPTFKEKDREEFATKLNTALEKRDLYRVDVLMHDYGVKYRRRNHNRKG